MWMGCSWNICEDLNTWNVFWLNQVQVRKVASGRRVTGAFRFLFNARAFQLEYATVLLIPVLMYIIIVQQ